MNNQQLCVVYHIYTNKYFLYMLIHIHKIKIARIVHIHTLFCHISLNYDQFHAVLVTLNTILYNKWFHNVILNENCFV